MTNLVNKANNDCRKFVNDLRAAIASGNDAIEGLVDMMGDLPSEAADAADNHRVCIEEIVADLAVSIDQFKQTCEALNAALEGGGIVVQGGGGCKSPRIFNEFYMLGEHEALGIKHRIG